VEPRCSRVHTRQPVLTEPCLEVLCGHLAILVGPCEERERDFAIRQSVMKRAKRPPACYELVIACLANCDEVVERELFPVAEEIRKLCWVVVLWGVLVRRFFNISPCERSVVFNTAVFAEVCERK